MHLIVDGYNMMSQSPRLQYLDVVDLKAGWESLLELLALYHSRSHHQGILCLYTKALYPIARTLL